MVAIRNSTLVYKSSFILVFEGLFILMLHEHLQCNAGERTFRTCLLWAHICWRHFTWSGIALSSAVESCGNCCIGVCFDGRVSLARSLSFLHPHPFSCKLQLIER